MYATCIIIIIIIIIIITISAGHISNQNSLNQTLVQQNLAVRQPVSFMQRYNDDTRGTSATSDTIETVALMQLS